MEQTIEDIRLDYLPCLPQSKQIGIGCIGSGFIMADCHLVAYRQAGFNPVAIASRSLANSQAVPTAIALVRFIRPIRSC